MQVPSSSPVPAVFSFNSLDVRVVDRNGEPWFVAADVCAALSVGNSSDVMRRLDEDEKGVVSIDTLGGRQDVSVVNESGLYAVVMTSRKPEAKKFKKWVTSEVLPAIRKTGSYGVPALPTDPMAILKLTFEALEQSNKRIEAVETQIKEFNENIRLHQWQCYELKLAVTNKVCEFHKLSGVEHRSLYSGIWNKLKVAMQVSSYQSIPAVKFDEAMQTVVGFTIRDMPDYVRAQALDLRDGGNA